MDNLKLFVVSNFLLQRRFDLINGAIPLVDIGCALSQWLVVSGPQAGEVWENLRADYNGIRPVVDEDGDHVSFSEWYLSWLDRGLVHCSAIASKPHATLSSMKHRSFWDRLLGR